MEWIAPAQHVQPMEHSQNPGGLYAGDLMSYFKISEDIKTAPAPMQDKLGFPSPPHVSKQQVEAQLEALADQASMRGEGPGGESERLAAQYLRDHILSHIMHKGIADQDVVREVTREGAKETMGTIFSLLQNSRRGQARALSQVAALQEALDEADRELMRMREEAEIVSIHAASTRAMLSLSGQNPSLAGHCDAYLVTEPGRRTGAGDAELARQVAACERQAEATAQMLGEVMRASWHSGAEVASLRSQVDLLQTRAKVSDRLNGQLAAASKKALEDEGRLIGLRDQVKALQDKVVGEEVLRRGFQDTHDELERMKSRLAESAKQMERATARCEEAVEGEAACKALAREAAQEALRVCDDLQQQKRHALAVGALNVDLERQLADAAKKMSSLEASSDAAKLHMTEAQLACKQLEVDKMRAFAELAALGKELEEAQQRAALAERKTDEVDQALQGTDRLLLAARAQCAQRDEQLEQLVAQLGAVEEEAKVLREDVSRLGAEREALSKELEHYHVEAPRLQAAMAEFKTRAEQAEARHKALEAMLDQERKLKEELYSDKASLEQQLSERSGELARAEALLRENDASKNKVMELSESLEWEKKAREEGAKGLIQLQQELAHQKALVVQTCNELDAASSQLSDKTSALDHQCKVNAELRAEIEQMKEQVDSKEEALSQRTEELEFKQSENSLLKVSVTQALNEQRLAQESADSKDQEAAETRLQLLQLRSSTWADRGAVSLEPTPRAPSATSSAGVEEFSNRPNTQRSPRYSYKKGLF